MWSRRAFGSTLAAAACGSGLPAGAGPVNALNLSGVPLPVHEQAMRLAIAEARANPAYPFGAVIVRAADRQVLASGVNNTAANPTFHGEIVAMNDYVAQHGNRGWGEVVLYTTGEPCPMCMSAMVWAGIGGVVYGTPITKLAQYRINQILIPSTTVKGASPFYHGFILGGVLEAETDALFRNRKRL
jgi:tRNA(adenine34) deaminase